MSLDPDDVDRLIAEDQARASASASFREDPPAVMGSRDASSQVLGAHVVDWRRLRDEDAAVEWRLLRAWVEWFTVRYNIAVSVVPDCWWQHGALVEELSALRTAHLTSFDAEDTGYGPIGWHERLALAHARLQRAGAGCASGHHSIKPRSWSKSTDESTWDAWITQNHAHRDAEGASQRKEE